MEKITVKNLSFKYNLSHKNALNNININIKKGEFITLCGKSGSGKSSLLRHFKTAISPQGNKKGSIFFDGIDLSDISEKEQAKEIGFVSQSAENQIVSDKVYHELAFTLESLSYNQTEIRNRVSETASFFGIQRLISEDTYKLSGGQKQILTLASVMVLNPSLLILDEPTSQLDPIATADFFAMLKKINEDLGTTIIISEHRLLDIIPISTRVIVMDKGNIIADGSPHKVGQILYETENDMFNAMPVPIRLYYGIENNFECPITIKEGRKWLNNISKVYPYDNDLITADDFYNNNKKTVLEIKEVFFRYERDGQDIIKDLSFTVYQSEIFALLGGNGTGKSTTLSLICGILKPYHGKIKYFGNENNNTGIILLPQNPQSLFIKDTVYGDLETMFSDKEISEHEKKCKINEVLNLCELSDYMHTHPYDLSGGEQQRLGLAKVLLTNPKMLLLDEPTKGLDVHFKRKLFGILNKLKENGITIIIVSHDIEFCAAYADRCAMFFDGQISGIESRRQFFKTKTFYTTVTNKMSKEILKDAIIPRDVLSAFGKKEKELIYNDSEFDSLHKTVFEENYKEISIKLQYKSSKHNMLSIFMVLFLVPITIFCGIYFFGDRKYYFISLLIVLEALTVCIVNFETKKIKASEIVIMSIMCAIAVIGRVLFYMLPEVKPIIAIIIISGISLGKDKGFLIGVFSALISNMMFGQGSWTPYQMFAYGICGYIFGFLSEKKILPKNKLIISFLAACITFFVCGVILDISSALMWQPNTSVKQLIPYLISGMPFNLILAVSTFIFIYILSEPLLKKIERVKRKYNI